MSSSSSDNQKPPSKPGRTTPSLKLKNPNVERYRAANNAALGLLAMDSDAEMPTSPESVASLNDNFTSNDDAPPSPSETSETSEKSNISDTSIAAHVAAIDAVYNEVTASASLSARRKGKAPVPIDTAIATAAHPDLNSEGDAPPSIESLSPQIAHSGGPPPSEAPSSDGSSSSSPTPELSPTPPPEWLRDPYYPTKMVQMTDGSFVPEGPSASDTVGNSWYFHPSRRTKNFTTLGTHMANAIIPSQAAHAALQAILAAQQGPVAGSSAAGPSTARPPVLVAQPGTAPQTSTVRTLLPAALNVSAPQAPVAVMLPSAAVPPSANAPQVPASATLQSTAAQTVNAAQVNAPQALAPHVSAPQVPASVTVPATAQALAISQDTNSAPATATTTAPVPASNGLSNNGSSGATGAADPSTDTFTVLSVTHIPGSTPVKPRVDPENPVEYLDVPWKCANRNCNTGQTWLDRSKVGRKCTSDFFGKNKNTTREIPVEVWHWLCRKEYQRKGNRLTKYSQGYQLWKLDHARIQFLRIGLWRPAATFTIRLTEAMNKRLAAFHTIVRGKGADRDVALAELDNGKEFKVHKKNKMQLLPPEMACPMDVAEHFEANYRQTGASINDCLNVMDWMVAVASSRSLANDLPVEFLMDKIRDGETLRDPNDNYRQWISFEDRLVANAISAGLEPSPDNTYAATSFRHLGNARTLTTQTSAETATAVAATTADPAPVATDANADTLMPDITADNIDVQAVKGLLYLTGQYLDLPTDKIERALAAASTQAAVTGDMGSAIDYQHTASVHVAAARSIAASMPVAIPEAAAGPSRKRSAPTSPEPGPSARRARKG